MGVRRLIGIEATFGGPNALAGSIVLSLPFWLFLWRRRRDITVAWPSKWVRLADIGLKFYPALAVFSVLLTNSRTGIVNLCVFLFLAGCRPGSTLKTIRNSMIIVVILALSWTVLPSAQRNRIRTIWDDTVNESATASAEGRTQGLLAGLQMFQRFPFLGVGPGCFVGYRVQNLDGTSLVAHNLIGQTLGETGGIGAIAFIFLVGSALINVRRTRNIARECPDSTIQILADLARSCRDVVILAFVDGTAGSSLYRYNWLWLGAFCALAFQFASRRFENAVSAQADGLRDASAEMDISVVKSA